MYNKNKIKQQSTWMTVLISSAISALRLTNSLFMISCLTFLEMRFRCCSTMRLNSFSLRFTKSCCQKKNMQRTSVSLWISSWCITSRNVAGVTKTFRKRFEAIHCLRNSHSCECTSTNSYGPIPPLPCALICSFARSAIAPAPTSYFFFSTASL